MFVSTSDAKDPTAWDSARPPVAERAAIERLLRLAPPALRLHVAHVTQSESVDRLRAAGVSFEVTPHHLLLSEHSRSDAMTKVNPPLRSEKVRRALWERFLRGDVPCVASDHAPHSLTAKERRFPLAPSGMPGVETLLPLLLASVRSGALGLPGPGGGRLRPAGALARSAPRTDRAGPSSASPSGRLPTADADRPGSAPRSLRVDGVRGLGGDLSSGALLPRAEDRRRWRVRRPPLRDRRPPRVRSSPPVSPIPTADPPSRGGPSVRPEAPGEEPRPPLVAPGDRGRAGRSPRPR